MCYSAEASFTAATVVGFAGIYTLKAAKETRLLPLALMPLMFAMQQATEGVLWVSLSGGGPPGAVGQLAGYAYIFFAFFVWPFWFPFSAWMLESQEWRRRIMTVVLVMGAAVSAYNMWTVWFLNVEFRLVANSVRYVGMDPSQWACYLGALTLPYLIASHERLRIVGVLAPISFFSVGYLYYINFASIWCFWAALLSTVLYKLVKDLSLEMAQNTGQLQSINTASSYLSASSPKLNVKAQRRKKVEDEL